MKRIKKFSIEGRVKRQRKRRKIQPGKRKGKENEGEQNREGKIERAKRLKKKWMKSERSGLGRKRTLIVEKGTG